MESNTKLYQQLSILAACIFLILIGLQIHWLREAAIFQKTIAAKNLALLAPEIALEIDALDHDAFHVDIEDIDRVPDTQIETLIHEALKANMVTDEVIYGIYDQQTEALLKSNAPEHIQLLLDSEARACLSCIVAFSTIEKEKADSILQFENPEAIIHQTSTFQYYSPISRLRKDEPEVWFILHQIDTSKLDYINGLFVVNMLILAILLALFYYLLRSLASHKRMTKVKEDFFNNVTHEFKTPLSSIRLASKALISQPDPYKQAIYIELIDRESRSLEYQIDKLLELSLADHEAIQMARDPLSCLELFTSVSGRLHPLIERQDAYLNIPEIAEDIILIGDRQHLTNAFCNLVENSLKYNHKGVIIDVKIEKKRDDLIIQISDNGTGISPKHHPYIFDRFYRAQDNDQYKGNGFGIGLSYVKSVIEAHKGKITIDESSTTGTSFCITLPL